MLCNSVLHQDTQQCSFTEIIIAVKSGIMRKACMNPLRQLYRNGVMFTRACVHEYVIVYSDRIKPMYVKWSYIKLAGTQPAMQWYCGT